VSSNVSDAADGVTQQVTAEPSDSQVTDNSFLACSDHQPTTSPNAADTTDYEHGSSEVQREVTHSSVDEDFDNDQKNAVTQSAVDTDAEESRSKLLSEFNVDIEESQDGQTKPTGESDLDKTLEDDEKEPSVEECENADENKDMSTAEPIGVHEAVVGVEVPTADDSIGDEPNSDQFLSPAVSETDITESVSPTDYPAAAEAENTGSSATWSAKVPMLDTEPPAMDSDYEEAALCEMDEDVSVSASVGKNDGRVAEDSCEVSMPDEDSGTTNQASTSAASSNSSTVKPKPM